MSFFRVPVAQLTMVIERGGQEMSETSGSEELQEGLHRGASLQVPPLELPTGSGMDQSKPSLTQPHGFSSLVSFVWHFKSANPSFSNTLILC